MSIANDVRIYLRNKPYMLAALERDIANLSKMSKIIQKDLDIESNYAVKAALVRYSQEVRKTKERMEEKILKIFKNCNVSVWDNTSLIISDKPLNIKNRAKVKIEPYHIYIVDKRLLENFGEKDNILQRFNDCTVIHFSSPKEIQKTPGYLATILSILAEQNINVIEFFSCYAETVIVVERFDALRTYDILYKLMG
jgi:aspartokinase